MSPVHSNLFPSTTYSKANMLANPNSLGLIFITPNQARRAARSLNYRRRLNEKVPELEAKLVDFLRERKTEGKISALLGTYKVTLKDESLTIEEVDPIDPNQLRFEFYEEVENEDRKSREGQESRLKRQ